MRIDDFYFDEVSASSKGFVICTFNGTDGSVSLGADIQVKTSNVPIKDKQYYHGISYDGGTITFSLQLMRYHKPTSTPTPLADIELGELNRWLTAYEGFRKLELITGQSDHLFMHAYASLKRIEIGEQTVGIEVAFVCDSNSCRGKEVVESFTLDSKNNHLHCIKDYSDRIGYQYPSMTITILKSGDLKLHNSITNKITVLKNCKAGEVIFLSGESQIVKSIFDSHKIYNDFNFVFPKIANKKFDRDNVFSSNLDIKIDLKYSPIRLIGGVV